MKPDRPSPRCHRKSATGFTLPELLVLVTIGSILTGLILPGLSQTKSKLLQQACVANERQWGMALYLYSQDYDGKLYYQDSGTENWDESRAPYIQYLGSASSGSTSIRMARICPAVAATNTQAQILATTIHSYSLVLPSMLAPGVGWFTVHSVPGVGTFLDLRIVSKPSQFLLLMDTEKGSALSYGTLVSNTRNITNRHSGTFNLLFGDFHVQNVPYSTLQQQDTLRISQNPWFQMN
jgi:prepilin-type processing-associated H-X9-DG protein